MNHSMVIANIWIAASLFCTGLAEWGFCIALAIVWLVSAIAVGKEVRP